MKSRKKLNLKRKRRAARTAARIRGTAARPRLVVNRSNRYLYAQLIDDARGVTLAAVTSRGSGKARAGSVATGTAVSRTAAGRVAAAGVAAGAAKRATKSDQAFAAGEALAKKAAEKKIASAVFDRRAAKFHGRVKSFAEGAKKGGLKI